MNIEKDNEIIIKKVNDGFIVQGFVWEKDNKEGKKIYSETIEIIKEDTEKQCLTSLFNLLNEVYGDAYDKYGKENLVIKWDGKGHKL